MIRTAFLLTSVVLWTGSLALGQEYGRQRYGFYEKYPYYGLPERYRPLPESGYSPYGFPQAVWPRYAPRVNPFGYGSYGAFRLQQELTSDLENARRAEAYATDPGLRVNAWTPQETPLGTTVYQRAIPAASSLVRPMEQGATTRPATGPSTRPADQVATSQPTTQWTGMRQVVGELQATWQILYSGESVPHVGGQIRSGPDEYYLVDFGPQGQLAGIDLKVGDVIRVFGHPGLINGRQALFVQVIRTQTQSYTIQQTAPVEVPAAQPATRPATPEREEDLRRG